MSHLTEIIYQYSFRDHTLKFAESKYHYYITLAQGK